MGTVMYSTNDLSKFGYRERQMASKLLSTYQSSKDLTKAFEDEGLEIMFNTMSGYVFLTNSEYQVALLDENENLVDYLHCSECGREGTLEELKAETEEFETCCTEMLKNYESLP
jgi:CRISPR/Cas system Type II protein with McrA/HNH and RuvC-like nuclease domain